LSKFGTEMKRIFVSDVHMGAGKSFQAGYTGHVYDWLSPDEALAFADFLIYLNNNPQIEEIILLGDIMDNWVCPVDINPPTFEEIVAAEINNEVVTNLKTLSENKKTLYIPGNHDMSVTEDFLQANFKNIVIQNEYNQEDIFASHGSEYSIFCAADPVNDVTGRLPIGYYISRVAATNAARTGSKNNLRDYIKALEKLVSEKPILGVLDAAVAEAHLADDTNIIMNNKDISVKEVKERYVNLHSQWDESGNLLSANAATVDEINQLWTAVWELNNQKGYKIIIFGHTHDSCLDKFPKNEIEENIYIYANTGAWCMGNSFTFVETEKSDENGKHYVRLKTWDGEKRKPADNYQEESID